MNGFPIWTCGVRAPASTLVACGLHDRISEPLRDWAYDLIACNRHLLTSKRDDCMSSRPERRARGVAPEVRT